MEEQVQIEPADPFDNGDLVAPWHAPRRRLGVWGWFVVTVILGGVIVGIPVLSFVAWNQAARKRVALIEADIVARGEPVTPADLAREYRARKTNDDLLPIWNQVVAELYGAKYSQDVQNRFSALPFVGSGSETAIPRFGVTWQEQQLAEEFLAKYEKGVAGLHRLAEGGYAIGFDLQFENRFAMLLEHAQALRGLARVLALEATVRAHRGDVDGAVESLHALGTLTRSIRDEPLLVSQLVAAAVDGVAASRTLDVASQLPLSDEQLRSFQELFRERDYLARVHHGIVGERAFGHSLFADPSGLDSQAIGLPRGALVLVKFRHRDHEFYLENMTTLARATETSWPEALQAADELEAKMRGIGGFDRFQLMLSALAIPAQRAIMTAGARSDANARMADAALGILRFRLRQGREPETLAELVPADLEAVPIDPYDGRPIRYKVVDGTVILYSVGPDRTDNDGLESTDPIHDEVLKFKLRPIRTP